MPKIREAIAYAAEFDSARGLQHLLRERRENRRRCRPSFLHLQLYRMSASAVAAQR